MSYIITKEDVWVAELKDEVGGLADRLELVSKAGINLEFMISRRAGDGQAVLFLIPAPGDDMDAAAKPAGLTKWQSATSVRIEGPDRPELVLRIVHAIKNTGVNMRGLSGATIGQRAVFQLAFDSPADASEASAAIDHVLNPV